MDPLTWYGVIPAWCVGSLSILSPFFLSHIWMVSERASFRTCLRRSAFLLLSYTVNAPANLLAVGIETCKDSRQWSSNEVWLNTMWIAGLRMKQLRRAIFACFNTAGFRSKSNVLDDNIGLCSFTNCTIFCIAGRCRLADHMHSFTIGPIVSSEHEQLSRVLSSRRKAIVHTVSHFGVVGNVLQFREMFGNHW